MHVVTDLQIQIDPEPHYGSAVQWGTYWKVRTLIDTFYFLLIKLSKRICQVGLVIIDKVISPL